MKNVHLVIFVTLIFLTRANGNSFGKNIQAETKPAKLNVLIIQPDQHRADVMGCAGNKMAITPGAPGIMPNP